MANHKQNNIILAGGGTGGHLYPAIAIGQHLMEMDENIRIHFVGTSKGLETRVVPELGHPLHIISVRGFSRRNPLKNLWIVLLLLASLIQSIKLLLSLKPSVVIGTGGYVSGPVLFMATLLRIPTIIQEQNSYPGITTRFLAKYVDQVHLSFKESKKYFKRHDNIQVTGNPVRKFDVSNNRENARVFFNLSPERTTVLVFGGSQGALAINNAFHSCLPRLLEQTDAQFIWVTGKYSFEQFKSIAIPEKDRIHITDYVNNMNMAYQASNLAVSRAGAIALSELAVCGIPSILVPYPYAAANHQVYNAESFASGGAATVLFEKDIQENNEILADAIINIINDQDKRNEMQKAARDAAFPDAVDQLAQSAINIMKKTGPNYGFFIPRQKSIIY